jgi:hypothetical protein
MVKLDRPAVLRRGATPNARGSDLEAVPEPTGGALREPAQRRAEELEPKPN